MEHFGRSVCRRSEGDGRTENDIAPAERGDVIRAGGGGVGCGGTAFAALSTAARRTSHQSAIRPLRVRYRLYQMECAACAGPSREQKRVGMGFGEMKCLRRLLKRANVFTEIDRKTLLALCSCIVREMLCAGFRIPSGRTKASAFRRADAHVR